MCETPGVLTAEQHERIARVQSASGRTLAFLASRFRCGGYTNLARHYISSGRVGRIYRAELVYHSNSIPTAESSERNGLDRKTTYLFDQVFDLLNWPRIQTVCAYSVPGAGHGHSEAQGFNEHQISLTRLAGDVAMSIDMTSTNHCRPRHTITILGDKGGLLLDHSSGGRGFCFMEEAPGMRAKLIESIMHMKLEPWGSVYRSFREHLQGECPHPGATIDHIFQLAQWRKSMRESVEQDREVSLQPASVGCRLSISA